MVNYNPNMSGLIAKHDRSSIEYAELGRKGGIASGEARRRKKDLREAMEIMLSMSTSPGEVYELSEHDTNKCFSDMEDLNFRVLERMVFNLISKALEGNTGAFRLIYDIMEGDNRHNSSTCAQDPPISTMKVFTLSSDGVLRRCGKQADITELYDATSNLEEEFCEADILIAD